jgi:flagellar M-ring protein FliF
VNPIVKLLQSLGPGRLAAMGGVVAGLIGFFAYLGTQVSEPNMALLYGDLDVSDSSSVVA